VRHEREKLGNVSNLLIKEKTVSILPEGGPADGRDSRPVSALSK